MDELKPCPFCGGTDIRFSVKKTGRFEFYYHAAMYCNQCHCYGARIHTAACRERQNRYDIENDAVLKHYAVEAWNRRADNER